MAKLFSSLLVSKLPIHYEKPPVIDLQLVSRIFIWLVLFTFTATTIPTTIFWSSLLLPTLCDVSPASSISLPSLSCLLPTSVTIHWLLQAQGWCVCYARFDNCPHSRLTIVLLLGRLRHTWASRDYWQCIQGRPKLESDNIARPWCGWLSIVQESHLNWYTYHA